MNPKMKVKHPKHNYLTQGIPETNECTNCGRRNRNSVKFCKCGFANEDYEGRSWNNRPTPSTSARPPTDESLEL